MKSKVIVIFPQKELWYADDFTEEMGICISSDKKWVVDRALEYKPQGYRIYIAEKEYEIDLCIKACLREDKRSHKKLEAILKGIFDQSHLRFTRNKIIKE